LGRKSDRETKVETKEGSWQGMGIGDILKIRTCQLWQNKGCRISEDNISFVDLALSFKRGI
jgi:hypothetical protein